MKWAIASGRDVQRLQEGDGDVLICSSAELTAALMDDDVIDDFRLMAHPIDVGRGKRPFGERTVTKSFVLAKGESLATRRVRAPHVPRPAGVAAYLTLFGSQATSA